MSESNDNALTDDSTPSTTETKEEREKRHAARGAVVDEEYKKLERFVVERRRLVLIDDGQDRVGGYGVVYKALLYHTTYLPAWVDARQYGGPQLVAVKEVKVPKTGADTQVVNLKRIFTREMKVWSELPPHHGIAKFLGFSADFRTREAWLLSPWQPNGNVSDFLRSRKLEIPEKLSLVYDTIEALEFLHGLTPPVCHGDIKSPNVIVNAECRALLCDFGLSRIYDDSGFIQLESTSGVKASVRWCSPEVLSGAPRVSTGDIFSWAWLVWEIMTGETPYQGFDKDYRIILEIFKSPLPQVNGETRLSECLQLWDLMMRCWVADPLERPTAKMCKTTVTYLPRCPPTAETANLQSRSAALLENLGALEAWKGDHAKSNAYLEEALRKYEEEGNTSGVAGVLLKQSTNAERVSDFQKGIDTATIALGHYKSIGDSSGVSEASLALGSSLSWDNMPAAPPILQEALEGFRERGNDVGAGKCLQEIGDIDRCQGRYDEALSALEEAAQLAAQTGDQLALVSTLTLMGRVLFKQGNNDQALTTLLRAREIARRIGFENSLAKVLYYLAVVKQDQGEYSQAEQLYDESTSTTRRTHDRLLLADILDDFANFHDKRGSFSKADTMRREAYQVYRDIGRHHFCRQIASVGLAVQKEQKEWGTVLYWSDCAIDAARKDGDDWETAKALESKGDILVELGRYGDAALHYEAAISVRIEHEIWLSKVRGKLAELPRTSVKWECNPLGLTCDEGRGTSST